MSSEEEPLMSESGGEDHDDGREPVLSVRVMARASVAVEAAVLLKTCLKQIYDISEFKCHQFQPSSHVTHKEKPMLRPMGSMTRINWQWSADQVDVICDPASTKSNAEDMARNQLGHFLELIETESVLYGKEDERENNSSNNTAKGHQRQHQDHDRRHGQSKPQYSLSRNGRPADMQLERDGERKERAEEDREETDEDEGEEADEDEGEEAGEDEEES
jgi:hypothetical protein